MDWVGLLISIVINTIIISPALWLSGRALVGKEKAKFTDAIWIALLGTFVGVAVGTFFSGLVAAVIMFIIWLALIKHFFDCGWIMSFGIALVAVIIFVVVAVILALIGFAVIGLWL
ncbi:hypothetical protein HXY33_04070 [Candidatus Bathyarchaeota archaeon]|nr:hypothetical protein [Candidatus Bathyarchaeota archaeon]